MQINDLENKALWLRQELWKMVMRKGKGHIPSAFSCVEILIALYYGGFAKVFPGDPKHPDRDRIIVSKGHAAIAQYPILADYGFFDKSELTEYTEPGGLLGMYADFRIPGIEGISGSLGHGVGMGAGYALAAKSDQSFHKSFVIVGDGECYEGSIWESAMFAAHHNLKNLIVIVDCNELCILGKTDELLSLGDLKSKWMSFGWEVASVNGHSFEELLRAFSKVDSKSKKPLVIIANTIKGSGISFMEGKAEWHNKIPSPVELSQGNAELGIVEFE